MIQYNNKQLRNLEEQVRENQRLIAEHYEISRVLQNYGIIIVGTVSSAEELPDPLTYTGSYGDAYSVGAEPPYTFYVFTRPNQAIGETDNRWLDVGELAIPGPQGPVGEPGPIGATGASTKWYSSSTNPAGAGFKNGDQWLNTTTGDVYQYSNNVWTLTGNVKGVPGDTGPRGPIGPQGNPGPAGPVGPAGTPSPIIDVLGELESIDQLPSPSTQPANAGYLIPISGVNHLFIIMSGQWADSGTWGGGSTITVGGQVVSNFDADTKLDAKASPYDGVNSVYFCRPNGSQGLIQLGGAVGQIPTRTTGGHISLPTTGFNSTAYAVPKKYVDDLVNSLGITPFRNTIWEGETTGGAIRLEGKYDAPPFKFTYTLVNEWNSSKYTIQTTNTMVQSSAGNYDVPLDFPIVALRGELYKFDVYYIFVLGSEWGETDFIELQIAIKKQVDGEWQPTTDLTITKIEAS